MSERGRPMGLGSGEGRREPNFGVKAGAFLRSGS